MLVQWQIFLITNLLLVTTTMDTPFGISTKLPPMPEENVEPHEIKRRNILIVLIQYTKPTIN